MTDDVHDVTEGAEPEPIPREGARDRFLVVIGHELRNSLAPTLLIADQLHALAAVPGAPPQLAARAAALSRNLGRLVGTVDRITEIANLRRGTVVLDLAVVDLTEVVAEVCSEAAREAAAAGAVLVIDAPAPVTGRWDRPRLRQIVANLVSNAVRYGGGGRIELSVAARGADAELVVRDHGPGIPEAMRARLFDPLDGGRPGGGFGIGLWIVKTLCTAMAGDVTCDPTNGGARFAVVLPRG